MWLYVPNLSTSSPSAPEAAGSISESSWQFPALEASVWWRGKPSRSRSWFQRYGKVSFIRLLCGAMPEPSTADAGVAAWTASLAASRASRTVSQDASRAASTSETYGAQRAVSSSSLVRGSSSSKTSAVCSRRGMTKSLALNEYSETFQSLVSRLREDCSRRRKLARRMSVSASSSSQWPTASATFTTGDDPDRFRERAARLKEKHRSGNGAGMTLATAANAWPSPATRDYKGANSADHLEAGTGRKHLDQLPNFVAHIWATPTASENSNRTTRMAHSHGKTHGVVLAGQAADFSRQDHQTPMDGAKNSVDRRILNPRFVEWLMGWPPMWTNSACSATELSLFKQRMRSALSQLALPAEAPPAQLALFG